MVVLVLGAALVPSVPVAPPFRVMLACSSGPGGPLDAARSYEARASVVPTPTSKASTTNRGGSSFMTSQVVFLCIESFPTYFSLLGNTVQQ
jgi:hypothetical protein